jgi:hypothetical protein
MFLDIGGTFNLDQWDTTPDPATIQRNIADHLPLHGLK